jgi:DNA replication protein
MKAFSGFPSGKVRTVGLPESAFTELIPLIDDLAELKLTLHALWRLRQQSGRVRYLRHADLISDRVLLSSLGVTEGSPVEALDRALARATERGTLLAAESSASGSPERFYFANTPKGRAATEAIARGEWPDELESAGRLNIYVLYEQNVGLLTPLLADELRQAEEDYPAEWIEQAFHEAVSLNKRSWRYIRAILERWRTEGRGDETSRRAGEADRRRYIEGEYGEYIDH